jgi:hypothetical protein
LPKVVITSEIQSVNGLWRWPRDKFKSTRNHPKKKPMSIQQIQQKMTRLGLTHILPFLSALLEEATKKRSCALEFFEKLLNLEVET